MAGRQKTLFAIEDYSSIEQPKLSGQTVRVVFDADLDQAFDYAVPQELLPIEICQRVEAPLGRGNKMRIGYCIGIDCKQSGEGRYKLKAINRVVDKKPLLNKKLFELALWISEYYVCPLGQVIAAMVPAAVKKGVGAAMSRYIYLDVFAGSDELEKIRQSLSRAKKQLAVIDYLADLAAFSPQKAIEQAAVETGCGASKAVLRSLFESGNVKYIKRDIVKSLPVVPQLFTLESGKDIILNDQQQAALNEINSQIKTGTFGVSLLHGVTDSGKTEIYIRAIEQAIKLGKKAIILLPEIALTTQTINRFSKRFERLAVLHSGLTDAQRNSQWQNIASGEADVVVGARSAIFAPLENIGIIIVDEEHEGAYKQDVAPRYNGRDVAIKRAQLDNAHCILGSATPSLETLYNCQTKTHFKRLLLTKRVMDLPMPKTECVDLSKQFTGLDEMISSRLEEALTSVLEKKQQAILLLNRRGYSNFVFCPQCKYILHCRNCDAALTFHRRDFGDTASNSAMKAYRKSGYAICHYCGSKTLVPTQCPMCRSGFTMCGVGVQKLEEQLNKKFPKAVVRRIDSDSMKSGDYYKLLEDFAKGDIDILAGTQILAKGLHFPNVTLVGIINADANSGGADFRANEKAFQLISQVAGRTGRGQDGGIVIVQTMQPQQSTLRYALDYDFDGFVETEMSQRKTFGLPPYSRMAIIMIRDEDYSRLEDNISQMHKLVDSIIKAGRLNINTRGPVAPTIARLNRTYRLQLMLFADSPVELGRFFKLLRNQPKLKSGIQVSFDIDPIL